MEHSTALAYGSTFPAWRKQNAEPDPLAHRNQLFDFVLVHQLAHEWWGNSVTARDWGDFWLHEGFSTYAESLVVEQRYGREKADEFFERMRRQVSSESRLYRGEGSNSEEAYGSVLYVKGAWVLNTLRYCLNDDAVWWRTLREFQRRFRYCNADTEDFRDVLEKLSGRSWDAFFDEWFYGVGYPTLTGTVRLAKDRVEVEVDNPVRNDTPFHVPLELSWVQGGQRVIRRVDLDPGRNSLCLPADASAHELAVVHLDRILGRHDVRVVSGE